MNGWSIERRKRQALAIRRWQPWKRATGPKTAKGKEASSRNSWKHGARSRDAQDMGRLLAKLAKLGY
jgi:hypothetical protein